MLTPVPDNTSLSAPDSRTTQYQSSLVEKLHKHRLRLALSSEIAIVTQVKNYIEDCVFNALYLPHVSEMPTS